MWGDVWFWSRHKHCPPPVLPPGLLLLSFSKWNWNYWWRVGRGRQWLGVGPSSGRYHCPLQRSPACGSSPTFKASTATWSDSRQELAQVTAEPGVPFLLCPSPPGRDKTASATWKQKCFCFYIVSLPPPHFLLRKSVLNFHVAFLLPPRSCQSRWRWAVAHFLSAFFCVLPLELESSLLFCPSAHAAAFVNITFNLCSEHFTNGENKARWTLP